MRTRESPGRITSTGASCVECEQGNPLAFTPSVTGREKTEAILLSSENRSTNTIAEMTKTISAKEEVFHRVSAALDRAKDQLLSRILERDHVGAMRGNIKNSGKEQTC